MDFLIGDLRMHSIKLMFDGLSVSVDSLQCVVDTRISMTSDETLHGKTRLPSIEFGCGRG